MWLPKGQGAPQGWYKPVSSGGGAFSLTLTDSAPSSATGTSVNYGTLNYGAGNTRVIVAIQWTYNGSSQAITGVTVGVTPLTQVAGAFVTGGGVGAAAVDVWMSSGPLAGSSGAVVVGSNAGGFPYSSSVGVYTLVTATPTPSVVATRFLPLSTSIPTTSAITVPAGGGAIALTGTANGVAISTFTPVTIDATKTPPGRLYYYGHTTATGSITPTAGYASSDDLVLSIVGWAP